MAKRDSQGYIKTSTYQATLEGWQQMCKKHTKGPKCDSNPALWNRVLAIAHMAIVNMNASLATKKVSREKTMNTLPEFFTGRPDEIGMRDITARKQRMEADSKRSQKVSWDGSAMRS